MDAEVIEGQRLPFVLLKPDGYAPGAGYPLVIVLHGFGASMYDLPSIAASLHPEGYVYAFPNAPYQVDLGIYGTGYSWSADRPGVVPVSNDNTTIDEKLDACFSEIIETAGAAPGSIILGGFSQGAGVTLRYGLLRPETFAGLVVLSGFFRDADAVRDHLPAGRGQPIFMAHGRQDTMIPLESALGTKAFLEQSGYAPEYHEYDMAHSISEDVLRDLGPWLKKTLPPVS